MKDQMAFVKKKKENKRTKCPEYRVTADEIGQTPIGSRMKTKTGEMRRRQHGYFLKWFWPVNKTPAAQSKNTN
jgi:hypothetical protein